MGVHDPAFLIGNYRYYHVLGRTGVAVLNPGNTGTASTARRASRIRRNDMKPGHECVWTRWNPGFTVSGAASTCTILSHLTTRRRLISRSPTTRLHW
jgi:hypothetical protein